jgi:hypothetical protein
MTLTHPAILLNDEFITANQLHQLHNGHQIVINEGKYGLQENGSLSSYFSYKYNVLAYPLLLPLLSLPVYWFIDLTGEHFVFLILIAWTVIALLLILFIHNFFYKYSYIGNVRWTPIATGLIILIFFINLYYYTSFPVDDPFNNFPEVIAIVFVNVLLLSLSGVMIYEINRTIFEKPSFSVFASLACLFSSSYFLWATFCKDHILVLTIFLAILLCLVRFFKGNDYWYIFLAFLLCGTLAWQRPELALWSFLVVCCVWGYTLLRVLTEREISRQLLAVLCLPLSTLFGGLPFFLNNYFMTKNFFMPPQSVYLPDTVVALSLNESQHLPPFTGVKAPQAFSMFIPAIPSSPLTTVFEFFRIFFYPENGSIGIFAVVPFAFTLLIIGVVYYSLKKIQFTKEEKKFLIIMVLMSSAVFLTYFNLSHFLNTDHGMAPDIRYLSPIYTPLMLIGFIILRKTEIFPDDLSIIFQELFCIGVFGLILSQVLLPPFYSQISWISQSSAFLGKFFSLYSVSLVILTVGIFFGRNLLKPGKEILRYLILLLCITPFFWQVNIIMMYPLYYRYCGYSFWIPIMNGIWKIVLIFASIF